MLEPGSALVADTMRFVAKVISIKSVRKRHMALTSGTKFNLGSPNSTVNLPLSVYTQVGESSDRQVYDSIDITGYTCIESDYLYRGYKGHLEEGDFVVFDNVGSYSIVFKPPFILPDVAIIEQNGQGHPNGVAKRRERFDDIFGTLVF